MVFILVRCAQPKWVRVKAFAVVILKKWDALMPTIEILETGSMDGKVLSHANAPYYDYIVLEKRFDTAVPEYLALSYIYTTYRWNGAKHGEHYVYERVTKDQSEQR